MGRNTTATLLSSNHSGPSHFPPMWFVIGEFFGGCLLIVLSWISVEVSTWSWYRVLGSIVFGSVLVVGVLGAGIDMSSRNAMNVLTAKARTRKKLFIYGVSFVVLSTSLALGMTWTLASVVDSMRPLGVGFRLATYVMIGIASIALSTFIVTHMLARLSAGTQIIVDRPERSGRQ